ncbi:MAG: VapC toxin family PIN domain ribonuclease [Dehalococcoidia bacterium]
MTERAIASRPSGTCDELDCCVSRRLGADAWRILVEDIDRGAHLLEPTTEEDLVRTVTLQGQVPSVGLGFVGAAVIAVCERLGERKVTTVDRRDFSVVVPRHAPYLEILPASPLSRHLAQVRPAPGTPDVRSTSSSRTPGT